MALHALCLFDGYGGFELAFKLAGADVRTVARVERDSHAAAVLVARMEEATLDLAPIWDDVTTFDGGPWRGRVDLITGGFPCQPFSSAGQQRGVDDERWLWPHIARIIADVRPRYVFVENVPGLVRLGLADVLSDLASLGFDAEWGLLSAADVGAPHKRERFWLLAVAHDDHDGLGWLGGGLRERGWHASIDADGPRSTAVADADRIGQRGQRDALGQQIGRTETGRGREVVGGAGSTRRPEVTRSAPSNEAGRCGTWPPPPDDLAGWERWRAAGGPEPSIRRSPDESSGQLGRPAGLGEQLHLLGNGLVPLAAAHAFRQLLARFKD